MASGLRFSDDDLKQLFGRALQGDERAWAELLDGIYGILVSQVRAAGVSGHENVEDAVQSVCLSIIRYAPSFRDARSPVSFLFRSAANEASRWNRRRLRRESRESSLDEALSGEQRDQSRVLSTPGNQKTTMLSKQVANAILQGIDSLRPLDRRYLLLRYGLGLSYDELAYVSGIAEGNLRVRIARRRSAILRHVRQVLNESLDGANIGKALKTLDLPAAEFPEPDPIASAFLRRRWLGGESLTLEEGQRLEDALAADEGLRLDSVLLRRTGEDQMDDEDVRAHSTTLHIPDAMLVRLLDEARRMGWIA